MFKITKNMNDLDNKNHHVKKIYKLVNKIKKGDKSPFFIMAY